MTNSLRMLGVAILGWASLSSVARGDEEKIALDKLPTAVVKAVKAKYAGAKLKEAVKEVTGDKTVYEVVLTHDGATIEVSVASDGKILLAEKSIETEDLPKKVVAAVKAKYPKGKISKAEEVVKDGKTTFEVIVEVKGKKAFEMEVADDGKVIEDEGDDDGK